MADATRAKFKVSTVTEPYPDAQEITLNPVYSPDPTTENYNFWRATPNGLIKLVVNNTAIFGFFAEGQEFYVDFTPAGGTIAEEEPASDDSGATPPTPEDLGTVGANVDEDTSPTESTPVSSVASGPEDDGA